MKISRYTENDIVAILKKADARAKAKELCEMFGISSATLYSWKSKFGGMEPDEVAKIRLLEEENRRCKSLLAESVLRSRRVKASRRGLRLKATQQQDTKPTDT